MINIPLLLALAVAPGLALILFIYFRDKYEREPLGLLIGCFFLGVLSIVPAIVIELLLDGVYFIKNSVFMHAMFGVGLVEEACKLFFVLVIPFRKKVFNEPYDGIVYAVMVSMGFATAENIMYVMEGGYAVGIMRMFTAVPAHCTFAVLMGYFLGLAKFANKGKGIHIVLSLAIPTLFHGFYDFFLFKNDVPGIWIGAIVSLIAGVVLSFRAIRLHRRKSPFAQPQEPGQPAM